MCHLVLLANTSHSLTSVSISLVQIVNLSVTNMCGLVVICFNRIQYMARATQSTLKNTCQIWMCYPTVWHNVLSINGYFEYLILRLTHLSPDTMTADSQTKFFECIFINWKFCILIRISRKCLPKDLTNNKPAMGRLGGKPLPEPVLTRFPDSYMRHTICL